MHTTYRAISAMALATHAPRAPEAREPQQRGVSGRVLRRPPEISLRGQRAMLRVLPLVAIVGLNAALLGGFVWSTVAAARDPATALTPALAGSASPVLCGCES